MAGIKSRLDQIIPKIKSDTFIQNKGLGNEIGFYIFDYDPKDELLIRDYIKHIKKEFNYEGSSRRIIEHDLYEILLVIAEERKILDQIPIMEEKKGQHKLAEALINVANIEAFKSKIEYDQQSGDVVLITGVGKVYPFIRSHNILNNLHSVLDRVPVIMFFPGTYDGQLLKLFDRFDDDNYYRAFKLIK